MNDELNKLLHPCGCGLTDDNKMIVCPMHYNKLKLNSVLKEDTENAPMTRPWADGPTIVLTQPRHEILGVKPFGT